MEPGQASEALRRLATAIERSDAPSRSAVRARLARLVLRVSVSRMDFYRAVDFARFAKGNGVPDADVVADLRREGFDERQADHVLVEASKPRGSAMTIPAGIASGGQDLHDWIAARLEQGMSPERIGEMLQRAGASPDRASEIMASFFDRPLEGGEDPRRLLREPDTSL